MTARLGVPDLDVAPGPLAAGDELRLHAARACRLHTPRSGAEPARARALRAVFERAMIRIGSMLPPGRARSIVLERLEEALLWGNVALMEGLECDPPATVDVEGATRKALEAVHECLDVEPPRGDQAGPGGDRAAGRA